MRYSINIDQELEIIKVVSDGDWDIDESNGIAREILSVSNQSGLKKILIDHSQLKIKVSKLIAFKRPNQLKDIFEDVYPHIAFIAPNGKYSLYYFFETVALNRGISLRAFKNEKDALNWLLNA